MDKLSMHSFFCEHLSDRAEQLQLSERDNKHLFRTLRGQVGDLVKLMDGNGTTAQAVILPDKSLKLTEIFQHSEPTLKLHLFVAPPRRLRMDSLLKQSAEIGIWAITPTITERAVAVPDKKKVKNNRWETLLIEGCKQSENPFIPQIHEPLALATALQQINRETTAIFFGETPSNAKHQPINLHGYKNIAWFVGPEGGFTDRERQLLSENGATPFAFGAWILRVETAAICGAAILMSSGNP